MSPDSVLFARMTVGSSRIDLGRAKLPVLLIRMVEELRKVRPAEEAVIQLEMSRSKLMDASSFNYASLIEQQLAAQVIADPSVESPFPGVSLGRVADVMSSPEYDRYLHICEPSKRMGLTQDVILTICTEYLAFAPDCYEHFPKWID